MTVNITHLFCQVQNIGLLKFTCKIKLTLKYCSPSLRPLFYFTKGKLYIKINTLEEFNKVTGNLFVDSGCL